MFSTVTRAVKKFRADNMTDRAAALTYYAMISLFPALLVGVSLLGLLGDESLVTKAVDYARRREQQDHRVVRQRGRRGRSCCLPETS